LVCPNNACTIRGGGFGLTPETAYTKTFGVVVRPRFLPGLTLSVDRFLIDLNDSIGFFSANDYIVGCIQTQDPYYCRGIVRNPGTFTLNSPAAGNPTTGFIIQGTTNGYKSKSHGWDFQAQWAIGLASAGKLDLSFNGTRMTLVGGQDAPNIAPRNCVGYYGPTCGESLPRWTHTMLTTYSPVDKSSSASVNWRYTGSQTVTYNAADAALGIPFTRADRRNTYNGIKSYSYFDLALSFDVVKTDEPAVLS
jgi:outer membrane receptor protein involved in Fe transport